MLILKGQTQIPKGKRMAVFDCETDPFLFGRAPAPFIIGYYDEKQYRAFREVSEFVEFIKTQDVICYAHNGGKFDFLFLVPFFEPDTKIFLINSRLAGFKLGKCEFRDSYLILPIPLAAYKKDEIDYNIFEKDLREEPQNLEKIAAYLKNDCIYLYDLIKAFRKKYGSNLTIASTAMAQWRKISGERAPHQKESEFVFFKEWYFGGRVQVFRPGIHKLPIKVWDINRAYSAAMRNAWFPFGKNPRKLDELPTDPETLGRCFLEVYAEGWGAFPLPGESNKEKRLAFFDKFGFWQDEGLSFPADGQKCLFKITGWEYMAAQRTGTLRGCRVVSCFLYTDKINFKEFVDIFYDPTIPRDDPEYIFKKLIGNSLYGKFGQDCRDFQDFYLVEQEKTLLKEKEFGGIFTDFVGKWSLIARPQPKEKQKFYNVAVAASITGFQRAVLWENICKTVSPFYCDTDCVHGLSFQGKIGTGLGEWKKEFEAVEGAYAGKKLYALRNSEGKYKIASKGARLDGDQIFEVASGKVITYRQDAPSMSLKGVKFQEREIRMTI